MPATDLQVFKRDAELLYLRGLQCAREGNRAGAALALRQAISLNPLHEQAWLRLSDTLDDPHEIAVCLQIALQINPNNAQAQRGLVWLRHQMRGGGHGTKHSARGSGRYAHCWCCRFCCWAVRSASAP